MSWETRFSDIKLNLSNKRVQKSHHDKMNIISFISNLDLSTYLPSISRY